MCRKSNCNRSTSGLLRLSSAELVAFAGIIPPSRRLGSDSRTRSAREAFREWRRNREGGREPRITSAIPRSGLASAGMKARLLSWPFRHHVEIAMFDRRGHEVARSRGRETGGRECNESRGMENAARGGRQQTDDGFEIIDFERLDCSSIRREYHRSTSLARFWAMRDD